MKQRINKMAAVFIASIFALSGLGVAYAAWTDTITITGTVTTGSLCWEFTDCDLMDDDQPVDPGGDYPTAYPDFTCNPGFTLEPGLGYFWELDKNVGWGEQDITDPDGDGCYDTLEVTLHNVYPCYFNELTFYINNCGTIPFKVDHILVNGVKYYSGIPHITFDLNGNDVDDFEIEWKDNFGYQMEPGAPSPEFSFWMHVLQDEDPAFQGGSFTFTIEVVCIQWNAYTGSPP